MARLRCLVSFLRMVTVRLEALDSVQAGTQVELRLVVTNESSKPVDLYLRGREPTMDVEVTRENGNVVWRRLEGEIIPAVLHVYTLARRAHLYVDAMWDLRVEGESVTPGDYVVNAFLLAEDSPVAAPARRLTIVA